MWGQRAQWRGHQPLAQGPAQRVPASAPGRPAPRPEPFFPSSPSWPGPWSLGRSRAAHVTTALFPPGPQWRMAPTGVSRTIPRGSTKSTTSQLSALYLPGISAGDGPCVPCLTPAITRIAVLGLVSPTPTAEGAVDRPWTAPSPASTSLQPRRPAAPSPAWTARGAHLSSGKRSAHWPQARSGCNGNTHGVFKSGAIA